MSERPPVIPPIVAITPQQVRAAQVACADHCDTAEQLRDLLEMLGITRLWVDFWTGPIEMDETFS